MSVRRSGRTSTRLSQPITEPSQSKGTKRQSTQSTFAGVSRKSKTARKSVKQPKNTRLEGTIKNPCENMGHDFYEGTKKAIKETNIAQAGSDMFNCFVVKNIYVDACLPNPRRNPDSFYSLIDRDLSQSDAIKIGFAIEKIFREIILTNPDLEDIRKKNIKGVKEKDHLFRNKNTGAVFYAEVKSNLSLDTEKLPATIDKIKGITAGLQTEYAKHDEEIEIKTFLFAPRYFRSEEIPQTQLTRFAPLIEETNIQLVGVNDYLAALGIEYQIESEAAYKEKLGFLAKRMFECVDSSKIDEKTLEQTALSVEFTPAPPSKHKSRVFGNSGEILKDANITRSRLEF